MYASKGLDSLALKAGLTEGEVAGIRIIQNAIRMPTIIIAQNAGFEGNLVAAKMLE